MSCKHLRRKKARQSQRMLINTTLPCREEAALSRLNDSDKMWAMLKKIAQQECTEGATPSPDSVLLRFLSLAPRVFSLNAAVKAALCDPVPATLSTQGETVKLPHIVGMT